MGWEKLPSNSLAFSCRERAGTTLQTPTISRAKRSAAMPGWVPDQASGVDRALSCLNAIKTTIGMQCEGMRPTGIIADLNRSGCADPQRRCCREESAYTRYGGAIPSGEHARCGHMGTPGHPQTEIPL